MGSKVAQVAFNVADVRKAAQDFNDIFGIGWVLLQNQELGENIAVSDAGLVLSENIDPWHPSSFASNWGANLLTALEIKVPDRDEVHGRLLARGVRPVYALETPGGLREYYYESKNFYNIPLTVTEYRSESFIEAIDSGLQERPADYNVQISWEPSWGPWSPAASGGLTQFHGTIPTTSDNRLAQVAFNVPGKLDAAMKDFGDIFGLQFVTVLQQDLGERVAVSDAGLVLSENMDESRPSPIAKNWGGNLVTALEIKVPDRDAVHRKLLARGVGHIFALETPGGLREYYYDSTNFYGIPLVVTEYREDSFIKAIDQTIETNPDAYQVQIFWQPGYSSWKPA